MGFISKPVFSRLAKRYGIRQSSSETLESGQVLVPFTDADSLLRVSKATGKQDTDTEIVHTYEVPSGKRWHIRYIGMKRAQAGSIAADVYGSYEISGVSEVPLYSVASATSYFSNLNFILDEGSSIVITFGSGTSGNLNSGLIYEEEDLY